MSASLDEQAAHVAGLLAGPGGTGPELPCRFGGSDAWLVQLRSSETVILKLGRPEQDEADVTWEHDHLRRLAETGFPASLPVPAFEGQSWVRHDGRIWAALCYLPGQPLVSLADPDMAAAGAFLARYHRAARSLVLPDQRVTAAELPPLRTATRWDHLRVALGDANTLARFERLLDDLESGLLAVAYERLEHLVIHGDATNDNLIVDGTPSRIVGMIDFGSAHVAPWLLDLAAALWRSSRGNPNGAACDPGRIRQYVAGYHRDAPLPPNVAVAIPLLMQGRGLQLISRRVRRLPAAQPGVPSPSVLDALVRAEWLHEHRADLADAITNALAEGLAHGNYDA